MILIKCQLAHLVNAVFVGTRIVLYLLVGSLLALFQERKRFYF